MVLRNNRYKRSRKRRGCKSRNRKGGKRSRRVKRRKSRKSRKRKRTRRRRRKKRMRGGSGCPYNKNLGEQITGRQYNNLAGPIPRDSFVSTSNLKQKGGAAAQNLAQGLGLGDLWGSYYGLGN